MTTSRGTRGRVALIGAGTVNHLIASELLHVGYDIATVVGRGAHRVGRDFGELSGGDPLGVTVRDDLAAALRETAPDVAMMATASTLADSREQILSCIEAGVPVITAGEEFLSPWVTNPELADELHAAAVKGEVAIISGGHVDLLWISMPLSLTGMATRIESLTGVTTRPFIVQRSSNARVAELLGQPTDVFPEERWTERRPGAALNSLGAIAAGLGATIRSVESVWHATPAEASLEAELADGTIRRIEPGTIAGSTLTVTMETELPASAWRDAQTVTLKLSDVARVGAHSSELWTLAGTPNGSVETQAKQGLLSTATQMINRIPDVRTLEPGLHTLSDLAPLSFR